MSDAKLIEIRSRDLWFKAVEMLQQNWAVIDQDLESERCAVYFIDDRSGVFDRLSFSGVQEAEAALRRNGFRRYADDGEAQQFIAAPKPPFVEGQHPNGAIYSSGRFWK